MPGVVEAMVFDAAVEVRPVLASFAHTVQPFLALVLTVAVTGVALVDTAPVLIDPSASVLALSAKEKSAGTVAVTVIWSLEIVAVAYAPVSMSTAELFFVPIVPLKLGLALDAVVIAAVAVQL